MSKSEFVEPINNVQCTIYNHAVVAIQAVIANHCTLQMVNCSLKQLYKLLFGPSGSFFMLKFYLTTYIFLR